MEEDDGSETAEPYLRIYLTLFKDMQVVSRTTAWARHGGVMTPVDKGVMSRESIFWQAIAHFLNVGGDIEEMGRFLQEMAPAHQACEPPEGYVLSDTRRIWFPGPGPAEASERVRHVFVNESTKRAIYWIENVERSDMDMNELSNRLWDEEGAGDDGEEEA